MTLKQLVNKYIKKTQQVLNEIETHPKQPLQQDKIKFVVNSAKRYLEDARYYRDKNKLDTALASVAYSEGLLDTLRLLGLAEFQWPKGEKPNA